MFVIFFLCALLACRLIAHSVFLAAVMLQMNRFTLPLICLTSLVFGFPNSPEYIPNSDSCSAIKNDLECAWKGLPELANLAAESLISWASSSGCDDTELVDDAMKSIFNVDRSIMSKGEVKEIYGTIGGKYYLHPREHSSPLLTHSLPI